MDLETCIVSAFVAVAAFCLGVFFGSRERRKVRIPRTTLWERTNRYHRDA